MRKSYCINKDWIFNKEGEEPILVSLPHTWNAIDGQDGGNDYYRGTCVYHKQIKRPLCDPSDRAYLEFRGVNSSASIKVNNVLCTTHHGGYSTFRVDITDLLMDENLIEVIVDNKPNDRVYPRHADFTFYGGIYRDVYLITVPKSHFDMDYYGSPGIKITPEIRGNNADVQIETYITGRADYVKVTIIGVGTIDCPINYEIAEKGYAKTSITIPDVHLWHGVEDPFLYQAVAELILDGQVIDKIEARFGCRSYSFHPDQGFLLNGKAYPLRGVSRHQDRKGVGNALTKEMHEEDIKLIMEMGANAIRLAHYQHDQYFYDLCDETGMVVWAEIPYISVHMPNGRENTISQMKELIVQNYNHPSIICWGLSNEVSITGVTEDLLENHRVLNDLAHEMDKSRVTAIANINSLEIDNPLNDIPDLISYNLYFGWYEKELEDNDKFFDEFHAKYPDKIIGLSEYGADANYKLQSSRPQRGDYSEQFQALYHEYMLEMISKRPYLWSTFVWNMFDFGSDAREEAGDYGINHKGLISFDRKVKKDAYYIYKAWWSKEPFVHLCGKRYVDRAEEKTEIRVYSNQNRVALYQDGALVEEKTGKYVFIFQILISKEHHIEVKSGKLTDIMRIRKVESPNPHYRLNEEAAINNWIKNLGMEIVPGYYSIKDTLGDIRKSPEGAALIERFLSHGKSAFGDRANNLARTDSMDSIVNKLTVEKLFKKSGNTANTKMLVELNQQLTKIKKPE